MKSLTFILLALCASTLAKTQSIECSNLKGGDAQFYQFSIVNPAAQESMADYDVKFYFLNIEVGNLTTDIAGSSTMGFTVINALDTVVLELNNALNVDSVRLGQANLNFSHQNGIVSAALPNTALVGEHHEILVHYHGTSVSGGVGLGQGMSNGTSPTWGNQATWTLSQPYTASDWFPVKQDLRDQADSVWIFVTTDTSNKVGSNGVLESIVPVGSDKHRFEWKSRYPINYYLISISVANYVEYSFYAYPAGTSDSILIMNYIYNNPATLNNFKNDIDDTKDMIELFSELYGLYPFYEEKYGHSMAPFGGGMEHQTMTTQGTFNFSLTAHELAHQWFGDHVTCNSWQHIFVNEGLATYSSFVAAENLAPFLAAGELDNMHSAALNAVTGSLFVEDTTDPNRIFNQSLTYYKGASLIHMIRYEIDNDSIFFAALREYQSRFSFSTADADDMSQVFEDVSGISFDTFFDQWYYGEGFPEYDVDWNWENGMLYLDISQEASAPSATPVFNGHYDIGLELGTGQDTILRLDGTSFPVLLAIPFDEVVDITFDPQDWILDEAGRVRQLVSLSKAEFEKEYSFRVSPNPAKTSFSIDGVGVLSEYQLLDVTGRVLHSGKFSKSMSIQRDGLPSGMYLLSLTTNGQSQHKRVVFE